MGWHPAHRLSVIHHEDIATAVDLALGFRPRVATVHQARREGRL